MSKKIKKGKVLIISGPSGSGKTTLYERLLKCKELKKKLVKTISFTTRHPRAGEHHGKDYFFISNKMFLHKKHAGHFLEYEKVFDHHYGTSAKQLKDLLAEGKNVALVIDVKGAAVIRKKLRDVISIFIKPPSMTILKKRLLGRKSEAKEVVDKRLSVARHEMDRAVDYDYCVINDNLEKATKELKSLVEKMIST